MKKTLAFFMFMMLYNSLLSQLPKYVKQISEIKLDEKFFLSGNLNDGIKMPDLSWAWRPEVNCFDKESASKFNGKHVIYALQVPPNSKFYIKLIASRNNENLSLYAYELANTDYSIVPDLKNCITCLSDFDKKNQSATKLTKSKNLLFTTGENSANIIIGVAGANRNNNGRFILEMYLSDKFKHDKQQALTVYDIKVKANKTLTYNGDLAQGIKILDLSWATKKNVNCFSEMYNEKFSGNQIVYSAQIPANYVMSVLAIPLQKETKLSLWTLQLPPTSTEIIPFSDSCMDCFADYKLSENKTRAIEFEASPKPYKAVIGVAGNNGVAKGLFELKITLKEK